MYRLIIVFFLLSISPGYAQKLSEQEVIKQVREFLVAQDKGHGTRSHSGEPVRLEKAYSSPEGNVCVYDAPDNGCFVIATCEPRTSAILGYSDGGLFGTASGNPSFRTWLRCCKNNIAANCAPTLRSAELPDAVLPLLYDTWHQYSPFWNKTPIVDSKQCLTGCVAHAMAEVMRYYEHPKRGNGSHTYTDTRGCGETLTAHFGEHAYDWKNILDSYTEGSYSQEQADAVAQLISDCGIAVDMRYSPIASGAYPVRQPMALTEYFGYDRGMQIYFRDFFPYSEWENMLKTELAEGRPILVTGYSATEAHAFVCDGYDENGLFHINWGWEGEANGYYDMRVMSPDLPDWFDRNNPEQGLNLTQVVCVGIRPATETASSERYSFGFSAIEPKDTHIGRNETFRVVTTNMSNIGWNIHSGRMAMALKTEGILEILTDYEHDFLLEETEDTTYTDTLSIGIPAHIPEGTYRIVPVYQEGSEWHEARTTVGVPNYLLAYISADSITIKEDKEAEAHLSITRIDFPDTLIRGSNPAYSITLHNGEREFFGRVYLALESESRPGSYTVFSQQGMTLAPEEVTTRRFNRTPFNIVRGKYKLRIFHDLNLFNDSIVMIEGLPEKRVTVVNASEVGIEDIAADTKEAEIRVYDLSGTLRLCVRAEDAERVVRQSSLSKGVYIVCRDKQRMKIVKY
ncbi:MAG: C10 family peptidase [Bacteroides sp.]|nr:C10 family peptidase [Roseburia sp.]MCM1346732.1 C10 family peptidase [Bacteroides sp.]MCM1420172.1 C10 family peptidase [Bacteroides sp.]